MSVVRNGANRGFARAVNRGGRLSRGEWVLLLNPDVTVPDGFLDEVLDAAQRWPARDPRAGVIGFQLRNRDGTKQASSGPFPTLLGTVAGLVLPRSRRKSRHRPLTDRRPVPWATGGCLLVRRDCFEELGGLDESFFLYYEDVDFCRRARRAGWSVWYEPDLRVTHHFPLHTRAGAGAAAAGHPARPADVLAQALARLAGAAAVRAGVGRGGGAGELLARWRGQPAAAVCFRELRRLVGDVAVRPGRGRRRAASGSPPGSSTRSPRPRTAAPEQRHER